MSGGDVIDFFWEWYRRHEQACGSPLCQHALDKCEEAFIRRDWEGFGYWYAIFARERQRMKVQHFEQPR